MAATPQTAATMAFTGLCLIYYYVGIFSHLFGELISAGEPLGSRNGGVRGGVSVRRISAKFSPFCMDYSAKKGGVLSAKYIIIMFFCINA